MRCRGTRGRAHKLIAARLWRCRSRRQSGGFLMRWSVLLLSFLAMTSTGCGLTRPMWRSLPPTEQHPVQVLAWIDGDEILARTRYSDDVVRTLAAWPGRAIHGQTGASVVDRDLPPADDSRWLTPQQDPRLQ